MCETCKHIAVYVSEGMNRYDPTHTTALRNRWAREMRSRFNELVRVVRMSVDDEDCFGLKGGGEEISPLTLQANLSTTGTNAFMFSTSGEKVNAFMRWFRSQVDNGILEVREWEQLGTSINQAWTNKYIYDSYKRGVIRARYELGKAGFDVPTIDASGGAEASMSTPFHLERVGVLYSRVFEDLRGITTAMDTQISRVLSQGLIDGDGPRLLARKLVGTINGSGIGDLGLTDTLGRFIPARRRAEILARTEVIRAHHQATIQEYKNWRAENVYVVAEFLTAGDSRVCDRCAAIAAQGKVYTLEEIQNMIPVHPQCRCIALPTKGKPIQEEMPIEEIPNIDYPIVKLTSGQISSIKESEFSGNLLIQPEWVAHFKRLGYTDNVINQTKTLLQSYGIGGDIQKNAMKMITNHLKDPNSNIGQLLRTTSKMEKDVFLTWREGQQVKKATRKIELIKEWKQDPEFMKMISGRDSFIEHWNDIKSSYGELMMYRGGSRDRLIQSWTRNPRGAKSGSSHFKVDYSEKAIDLIQQGYSPLGGFARMMGAPGESEVTWIKMSF